MQTAGPPQEVQPGDQPGTQRLQALVALFQQQRTDEALQQARAMTVDFPQFGFGWLALGAAWQAQGQLAPALEAMGRAAHLSPQDPLAHSNLGNALTRAGRLHEAEASCLRALQLAPAMAAAHLNLAVAQSAAGRFAQAQAAYQQALHLQPQFPEAWWNLALNHKAQGQLHEAARCAEQAVRLQPQDAQAHSVLGAIFSDLGQHDAAVAHCREALRLRPGFGEAWGNLLFTLNYHPDLGAEDIRAAYREFEVQCMAATPAVPAGASAAHQAPAGGGRLKVGYVSPAFKRHSCQHFLEPLLASHDKQAVEVFVYAELAGEDEVTARYRACADHWLTTTGMADEVLAQRIRDDGVQLLVDLAGHTRGHRLGVFARRPAPVSLHWLDFGYTTGLAAITHYLCDAHTVPPGADALFAERPCRLDGPALAYRPAAGMGEPGPLPALRHGGVTFGSLTRATRINHRTVRVWAQLLLQVPGSRLWLDSGDFRDAELCQSLSARFAAQGVDPQRLVLGWHSPPWDVLRQMDIMLDCFPHNSGTTLLEGLYMGLPVVTLAGRPSVGRLGASLLQALGCPQWVADDEAGYLHMATHLAADLPALAATRAGLRQRLAASPLMDEQGFARRVEAAYCAMWDEWGAANGVA